MLNYGLERRVAVTNCAAAPFSYKRLPRLISRKLLRSGLLMLPSERTGSSCRARPYILREHDPVSSTGVLYCPYRKVP